MTCQNKNGSIGATLVIVSSWVERGWVWGPSAFDTIAVSYNKLPKPKIEIRDYLNLQVEFAWRIRYYPHLDEK